MSINSRRIKFVSISLPILYGNHAIKLTPEKRKSSTTRTTPIPPEHTHEWTVFFKPLLEDIDLTSIIKKITFKLHETYDNPIRTLESPPYQITETGWGEFEIIIKIHFKSNIELGINEKNFQIFHSLKLHPYNPQQMLQQQQMLQIQQQQQEEEEVNNVGGNNGNSTGNSTGNGVGEEKEKDMVVHLVLYDELVFNEPTEKTFELLTLKPINLIPYKLLNFNKRDQEFIRPDEINELNRLEIYINKINQEIEYQKNQYKLLEQEKLALLE